MTERGRWIDAKMAAVNMKLPQNRRQASMNHLKKAADRFQPMGAYTHTQLLIFLLGGLHKRHGWLFSPFVLER